jgi:hypothetical protein
MSSKPAWSAAVARWGAAAATLLLAGCALHGRDLAARAPVDVQRPGVDTATAAPQANYVVSSSSYSLVTSSEVSRDVAVAALRATEGAFASLLGTRPPRIGIAICDSSGQRVPPPLVTPSSDLITFSMMGGGLLGPTHDRAVQALQSEVRLIAANAWIGIYAAGWNTMLRQKGIVFIDAAGEPISPARELPAWLHVATLGLLTRSPPDSGARDWSSETIPLAELFERRLTTPEIEDMSRHPDASLFPAQAASVLHYLRDTQGEGVIADIVGESVAGLGMRDILAHLPSPTTPEQLEADWHRWASRQGQVTGASGAAAPEVAP